jgi:trimethylamine---corrinoid protein Co-methyltransferase
MRLAPLQVLSDGEITEIHQATLTLLETCGVKILNRRMLSFLKGRGLSTRPDDGEAVVFSRSCVEAALASVPRSFEVFDRDGKPAFVLGDGTARIAAGHNAVFWVDPETRETRESTVADVAQFARICEQLPNIDVVGIPVMPQDVADRESSLLYGVKACIENSRKPLYFSTDNPGVNRRILEMLRAVFTGKLEHQPYGIAQLSPTSPLFWEGPVLDALQETVERNVPLAILPEPNAGVSAPYTLAGLLTVNNAECLSGIVIAQLLRPGAKVLYANSWTTTDMRKGYVLVGSVETSLCRIAGAQLARFYRVPCHTTAPNSDNHAHDEQNAWEKTLSLMGAVGAGNDLIVNCGMFATGMTCSHEQLLMDEEMAGMCRRLAEGLEVNEATLAVDLIREIGPRGTGYLTAPHTLERLRSREYFVPRLAVRGPRALWEAEGSRDTYELARQKARELGARAAATLDGKRQAQLNAVLAVPPVSP